MAKVLSLDETVEAGTDPYVDDIFTNEDIVSSQLVSEHLAWSDNKASRAIFISTSLRIAAAGNAIW